MNINPEALSAGTPARSDNNLPLIIRRRSMQIRLRTRVAASVGNKMRNSLNNEQWKLPQCSFWEFRNPWGWLGRKLNSMAGKIDLRLAQERG